MNDNSGNGAPNSSQNNGFLPSIDQGRKLINNAQDHANMFSAMDRSMDKNDHNIVPQLYGDDDQNLQENNENAVK